MIDDIIEVEEEESPFELHEGVFNPREVKFLVYGDSGAGKTVFSSTWPKPIFLDIDKGMASVTRQVHRKKIDNWDQLDAAILTLVMNDGYGFETIVVDSLNELQAICMANVLKKYPNIRRSYNSLASQADYGKMLSDFDKTVRVLRSIPVNVVFIAQVAPREYETDQVQPQLIGKSTSRNLARMMDVIGFLDKQLDDDGERTRVMTLDAINHVTKDRSRVLPPAIKNPTFDELNKYWIQAQIDKE